MTIRTLGAIGLAGAVGFGVTACTEDATTIEPETVLLSVAPAGGASDVGVDEPVVVRFDHAMGDQAMEYAAVHEGDVTGPEVAGSWMLEAEGTIMRFMPDQAWKAGTGYAIHLGGGMEDAEGRAVDLERHGEAMGGMWVDGGMMSGGMMGGGHPHTGEGWQHQNGSYGMVFTYATAGARGTASTALVSMSPVGGATDVDPAEPVVVTFDHAIDPAMAEYAALHEGDVNGPEVAGTWSLSGDSTGLVFTQEEPLKPATRYTIHLGGGMIDAEGHHVDLGTNGTHMGGEWATDSMMGGGMGGGGMDGHHEHTGDGWEHPDNGSYGMIFTFTTAG